MRLTSSRLWGKLLPPERRGRRKRAMRHERERGGSPLHPVVRVRASRQGQLPRWSRHPVRHSGRLSLSADNVLTSSFFFQNYSFQRGGSAERARPRRRRCRQVTAMDFKSIEFIEKLCHTVCARTSLVYFPAQGSKQRQFVGRKLGVFPPVRPTSARLGIAEPVAANSCRSISLHFLRGVYLTGPV